MAQFSLLLWLDRQQALEDSRNSWSLSFDATHSTPGLVAEQKVINEDLTVQP